MLLTRPGHEISLLGIFRGHIYKHIAQKPILTVSYGGWCFFLSPSGENTQSDTDVSNGWNPEKTAPKETLMLGFFGMTVLLLGKREGPDMLLFPRMLLVYWTASGFPVDGFAFAFLSFIYQGMCNPMFLLYYRCQIKVFSVTTSGSNCSGLPLCLGGFLAQGVD